MNKCMVSVMVGMAIGLYLGYTQEDEITDFYRKSKRNKKKMMRKIHKTYDHVCDCLEHGVFLFLYEAFFRTSGS